MTITRIALGAGLLAAATVPASAGICETTAQIQRRAAIAQIRVDLNVSIAACFNQSDPWDFVDCLFDSFDAHSEGTELAEAQFEARLELCELLGGGAYDPVIDPENFSTTIDNPHLPWPVGAEWVYESETEDGFETIVITVLEETRVILGVECVSVRDTVRIDGELLEDTIDWYAQDRDGNVWYFGEISFNYEDGYVADIDGSWLSGVDGAKPGIVMLGNPVPGITYRQEWLLGEAEDAATVLDDDATVTIDLGTYEHCVQTADFLPPDPEALEHKFYAPGIGFIYEVKVGSPEMVELVRFTRP